MKGAWRKKIRKRERGSGSAWFQKSRPWLDGRKKLKPKGLGVHGEVEGVIFLKWSKIRGNPPMYRAPLERVIVKDRQSPLWLRARDK